MISSETKRHYMEKLNWNPKGIVSYREYKHNEVPQLYLNQDFYFLSIYQLKYAPLGVGCKYLNTD